MRLVKILTSDDGTQRDESSQHWHIVETVSGGDATFCESEFFGLGESSCEFETKEVKRGGVTCPKCLRRVKWAKAIRL